MRPGYDSWLPISLLDNMLSWAATNRVPVHFERSQRFESLLPDEPVAPLLARHGIRPETFEHAAFRNSLAANQWGEVFALQKGRSGACGIARVADRSGPSGRLVVGDSGVWISNPLGSKDEKVVIVNSPLDALAYHQNRQPSGDIRYVATCGPKLTVEQKDLLKDIVQSMTAHNRGLQPEVVIATSKDVAGQRFAREVMDACPGLAAAKEVPPFGRDWLGAAELKERDLILSVGGPVQRKAGIALR